MTQRNLFMVATLAFGLSACLDAQIPSAAILDTPTELKNLERKYTTAQVFGDTKALADILDATFLDTDEEGHQLDKNGFIEAVKSGDRKMASISLSQLKIRSYVYTAVVAGRATQKGTVKGEAVPEFASFTDLFAMIDGKWKLVASHRSGPHTAAPSSSAPSAPTPPVAPGAPPAPSAPKPTTAK